jgi:hypothetical protein
MTMTERKEKQNQCLHRPTAMHLAFGGLISSLCSRDLLFQVLSHSYQRSKTFRRRRSKVGMCTALCKAVIACLSTLTNQVSTIKYTQIDIYLSMDKMYIFFVSLITMVKTY